MSYLTISPPVGFNASVDIVSCYVESDDRILMLLRHKDRYEGSRWGPPAGKTKHNELLPVAMGRELQEESGIRVEQSSLTFLNTYFVRFPDFDFRYHTFSLKISNRPVVSLSPREHVDYCWVTPREALKLPLVKGEDESIRLTFGIK